jgi:hypothetical protein
MGQSRQDDGVRTGRPAVHIEKNHPLAGGNKSVSGAVFST